MNDGTVSDSERLDDVSGGQRAQQPRRENVLRAYPALAARKLVPGEDTLNRLHPELADELAQFFSARSSRQVAETAAGIQALACPEQLKAELRQARQT